jgi:hypothetical protein
MISLAFFARHEAGKVNKPKAQRLKQEDELV